jgi:uncharacterized protein
MDIASEIERLEELRRTGVLSEEEFQQAKQKAIAGDAPRGAFSSEPGRIYGMAEQTWCTLMHLSQLLLFAGGFGIAVPIIMWVLSKEDSDLARRHGNRMMNWLISSFIYLVISGLLVLVLVGIPLLIAVAILTVVFPVMAALKANEGQLWSYPLTIRFLQED